MEPDGRQGKTESSADMLGTTEYKNHDTKTAAYLQYQGEAGRWSWWAGIRYEHLTSRYTNLSEKSPDNMERHYDQWFPSFGITLNEPSWHHSLSFRTTTARPSFSQLSGNIYYISRFQYQISNPKLQPGQHLSSDLLRAVERFHGNVEIHPYRPLHHVHS